MSRHKQYKRYIPVGIRKSVLSRDENVCQICGSTSELCMSRKIPGSKGGLPVEDNLQVMCRDCTAIKRDMVISNEDLQVYLVLYETQWKEGNDKHRIGNINAIIRRDLYEKEKSTPTNDRTNGHATEE